MNTVNPTKVFDPGCLAKMTAKVPMEALDELDTKSAFLAVYGNEMVYVTGSGVTGSYLPSV